MEGDNLTTESKNSHFGLIVVLLITLGVILFVFTKKDTYTNDPEQEQESPTVEQVKAVLLKDSILPDLPKETFGAIDSNSLPDEINKFLDPEAYDVEIKQSKDRNAFTVDLKVQKPLSEFHQKLLVQLSNAQFDIKKASRANNFGFIEAESSDYLYRFNATQLSEGQTSILIEIYTK